MIVVMVLFTNIKGFFKLNDNPTKIYFIIRHAIGRTRRFQSRFVFLQENHIINIPKDSILVSVHSSAVYGLLMDEESTTAAMIEIKISNFGTKHRIMQSRNGHCIKGMVRTTGIPKDQDLP